MPTASEIEDLYKTIQDEICAGLEKLDGKGSFQEDAWQRTGGGGGRTRILQNGNLIEKGGVNFSAVYGELPEPVKKEFGVEAAAFFATGVSIVLHPHNPHVPIIHMNIRYFEMEDGPWWFGGGIDLTPHYIRKEKAAQFHQQLQKVCDEAHPEFYHDFKKRADDYFFLPHRNETRGVGGIFYDRLNDDTTALNKKELLDYSAQVGRLFVPAYTVQTDLRDELFTSEEKEWQLLRRGRYVEFNLVYDKGTRFGLQTSGRIESILMSLPKDARWLYDVQPEEGSREAQTLKLLQKDINWINV